MKNRIAIFQGDGDSGRRLQRIILRVASESETVFFRTIQHLDGYLKQPGTRPVIVVLLADNIRNLDDLVSHRDLFNDFRIILVLPNRTRAVVTAGFRIFPRYISYVDSDFSDISAVLKKMLGIDGAKRGEQRTKWGTGMEKGHLLTFLSEKAA